VVGAGVAWAELFQGGTNHETVFECFYQAQITPRISFQPDLQYIASPSGIYRDALAVGVRFQLNL
jgi:carbohydrate-selective porin OprB